MAATVKVAMAGRTFLGLFLAVERSAEKVKPKELSICVPSIAGWPRVDNKSHYSEPETPAVPLLHRSTPGSKI